MKTKWIWILLLAAAGALGMAAGTAPDRTVRDLADGRQTRLSRVLAGMTEGRVILVGEHHSDRRHHDAQLAVIRTLNDAGAAVAVGLEMFRQDSQQALDDWTAGRISETDFKRIYADNWNFPWAAYRKIFTYAREHRIPLLGLNVPRAITRQVARRGFQSLTAKQRGQLEDVTCRVDKAYMDFIRSAFGGHAHGHTDFTYFCEAQLVWDNVMAVGALNYLETHPASVVVVLAGTGHARKPGVPAQIRKRADVPVTVFLPELAGSIDARTVDQRQADYLIVD